MAAHTVLFDFTVDKERAADPKERQDIVKLIRGELEHLFPQLELAYQMSMENGYFCVLAENKENIVTIRIFPQGLVTVNIEYFLEKEKQPLLTVDHNINFENILAKKLQVRSSTILPILKRGDLPRYFGSSDGRIIEYDIDACLYEEQSQFQKIQIVHSKSLGNMLVLDEYQNIAESDLIYTETLMCRGTENYEGKEICILGGGDGALLYELLKEKPKFVVMLEIDDLVMIACNKYMKSICGDVLEKRKGDHYDIIVGDCVEYMKKFISEGRKFDYVFGDLTDIPISGAPIGPCWDFLRVILEHSFQILKPDGKFLTHGNGTCCAKSLEMFEEQLRLLKPQVKFTTSKAFVPSFMEEWQFYQVTLA